jgi:hypothetical protein
MVKLLRHGIIIHYAQHYRSYNLAQLRFSTHGKAKGAWIKLKKPKLVIIHQRVGAKAHVHLLWPLKFFKGAMAPPNFCINQVHTLH